MFTKNSFFFLTAPPAWGKTRLFREWVEQYKLPFLYVSPLRALANEVMSSLADHPGLMKLAIKNDVETWIKWSNITNQSHILVVTPEELGEFDWQGLARKVPSAIIVWDEIHLVPHWGFEFRERLLQSWWGYIDCGLCGVGLTATADKEFKGFLLDSLDGKNWTLVLGDAGNFQFKNKPKSILTAPASWIKIIMNECIEEKTGNTLVFCAHRNEVDHQVKYWSQRGIQVLGCKGGETVEFQNRLSRTKGKVVIFSTSCLSHGVNLPSLEHVFVLYEEKNASMFHQMITRGGRKGESFEVLHPWPESLPCRDKVQSLCKVLKRVFVAQVWLFMGELWHGNRRTSDTSYTPKRA